MGNYRKSGFTHCSSCTSPLISQYRLSLESAYYRPYLRWQCCIVVLVYTDSAVWWNVVWGSTLTVLHCALWYWSTLTVLYDAMWYGVYTDSAALCVMVLVYTDSAVWCSVVWGIHWQCCVVQCGIASTLTVLCGEGWHWLTLIVLWDCSTIKRNYGNLRNRGSLSSLIVCSFWMWNVESTYIRATWNLDQSKVLVTKLHFCIQYGCFWHTRHVGINKNVKVPFANVSAALRSMTIT